MTRSVTIVNTSNWEHEDIVVCEFPGTGVSGQITLKPGDQMTCGPHDNDTRMTLVLAPQEPRKPVPFRDEYGNQDMPRVEVHKPVQFKEKANG